MIIRVIRGPGSPDGIVAIGPNLGASELHHQSFRLEQRARLVVHTTGSFETDTSLAVYGWVVDRNTREIAWMMDPVAIERGRGTLAVVEDTVEFAPGVYDAYFTTYGGDPVDADEDGGGFLGQLGDFFSNDGRPWQADEARWKFVITLADPDAAGLATGLDSSQDEPEEHILHLENLVWASGPAANNDRHEYQFEVTEATSVRVEALGEYVDGGWVDRPVISRLFSEDIVWSPSSTVGMWAGGSVKNRSIDTTVVLQPGLYSASYSTDRSHAYDRWTTNPPWIPVDWGLRVFAADSTGMAHIVDFDAWDRLPQIVSFTCVGQDAYLERSFSLADSTDVLLYALGEISGSSRYDYTSLVHVFENRRGVEEVWTMTDENTVGAGGNDKNRRAEARLELAPGIYRLTYQSDRNYDCEDFYSTPPDHPQRWGATLFALDPDFDLSTVEEIDSRQLNRERLEAMQEEGQEVLIDLTRVGNGQDLRDSFNLANNGMVHIYALGELTPSSRYDYAWIENSRGQTVWEMTRENTSPAGGTGKNRVFDGDLELQRGHYTVYYESDGSHAFGDFDQESPYDPESWGITVYLTNAE